MSFKQAGRWLIAFAAIANSFAQTGGKYWVLIAVQHLVVIVRTNLVTQAEDDASPRVEIAV